MTDPAAPWPWPYIPVRCSSCNRSRVSPARCETFLRQLQPTMQYVPYSKIQSEWRYRWFISFENFVKFLKFGTIYSNLAEKHGLQLRNERIIRSDNSYVFWPNVQTWTGRGIETTIVHRSTPPPDYWISPPRSRRECTFKYITCSSENFIEIIFS